MAEVVTARDELNEIAELLREADENAKDWAERKDRVRGPFLDLISEVVREEYPLKTATGEVALDPESQQTYEEIVEDWRSVEYPEYVVDSIQPANDGEGPATKLTVTLKENDELVKFEFVYDGYKFGRTVRYDGKGFDAEGFYKHVISHDSDVGNALAECVKVETITTYKLDEVQAEKVMADYPEVVTIFQAFVKTGTPKAALLPIKKVKETE